MKAWEKSLEILQSGSPCYEENDNETIWEEEANGPEMAQDALTKMHWHSQVPGSRAHESICLAAVQATENKGFKVENGMELIEEGFRVYEEGDLVMFTQGMIFDEELDAGLITETLGNTVSLMEETVAVKGDYIYRYLNGEELEKLVGEAREAEL